MYARRHAPIVRLALAALVFALVLLAGAPVRAQAADYSIDRVDIEATINTDGSVSVLETREFDFDDSFHGVYWKIPKGSYEGRQVDVTVTRVGEIINGSFVAFAEDYSGYDHTYQLTDYGSYLQVKLYSAHSYDTAHFVIGYTDTNLAARYDDVSQLYWKFVSDGWDVESQNVTCVVHLPVPEGKVVEPEENVRAWGHGPLDASVAFDGNDVVYSVPGVGTSEFAEARITFPTEWLSETSSQGGRVLQDILAEERQWADEANARRRRARILTYGGSAAAALLSIGTFFASLATLARYRRQHKPTFDDKYFRDVPSDDHPAVLGALWRDGSPEGDDLTATLVRLTDFGAITLEQVTVQNKGFFGRTKQSQDYRLTLNKRAEEMTLDAIDRRALRVLFDDIERFAHLTGDYDPNVTSILFSDFEKVAKKHPERYDKAIKSWNSIVNDRVAKRRFFKSDTSTGSWIAALCITLDTLLFFATVLLLIITEAWALCLGAILLEIVSFVVSVIVVTQLKSISSEAIELKAKLAALRRWLKDFTRLEEAVPRDVVLWNRLLVMAVVLGVADEVIRQLEMVAPEVLLDQRMTPTYGWYYGGPNVRPYRSFSTNYDTAHSVSAAALSSSSSSSGGGGGGGFSGGGGGGFGGGGGGGAF